MHELLEVGNITEWSQLLLFNRVCHKSYNFEKMNRYVVYIYIAMCSICIGGYVISISVQVTF